MSLYKPFGIYSGEIVDPDQLTKEFTEAKKIAENTTSWQWMSNTNSGLSYDTMAENGAGVIIEQRQRAAYIDAGKGKNYDANNIKYNSLPLNAPLNPWYIPYMRGWHHVWGGELNVSWNSSHSELVLIGYSFFAYRLSSKNESRIDGSNFFSATTMPRIKFGVRVDGAIVEGSGCGTNVSSSSPEIVWGSGSRQKAIVSSSNSVQMLGAGSHTVAPVAGQGPCNITDKDNYYHIKELASNVGEGLHGPSHGVVMVNARLNIVRFPRGRKFGV